VSSELIKTATERAIESLAEAFCTLKRPNFQIYKTGLESIARIAQTEQLDRLQKTFDQANAALKD
jgi:hypothetical protein